MLKNKGKLYNIALFKFISFKKTREDWLGYNYMKRLIFLYFIGLLVVNRFCDYFLSDCPNLIYLWKNQWYN